MKIVHLLGCPIQSGAGRGALALHSKLLDLGIDSTILGKTESGLAKERAIVSVPRWMKIRSGIASRFKRFQLEKRYGSFPLNFEPSLDGVNLHHYKEYQDADIVHIQWANGRTFSKAMWAALANEPRPVFWTLRDMWPFTGGCHFSAGCTRYQKECGGCPLLDDKSETLTRPDLAFKARHYANITFLTISNHFAKVASKSSVLKNEVQVIANSIDIKQFGLFDKTEARNRLGLPQDAFLFSAGAINFDEERKGGKVIAKTMAAASASGDVHLAVFGSGFEHFTTKDSHRTSDFGLVKDTKTLNLLYAASDVYLMPSTEESFGKTIVEAMASGTPVLAYDNTPADDIIDQNTGFVVPFKDDDAFVRKALELATFERKALLQMGERARLHVERNFSSDVIARQHIELYKRHFKAFVSV